MAQLIPGHLNIGVGFNAFGPYDESSIRGMRRLFNTEVNGFGTWKDYALPDNVSAQPLEERKAEARVFESRDELADYFKVEAGAKGSYLSFSASFSASFESISKSSSEYFYGMAAAYTDGYEVALLQGSPDRLAPEVLTDPDYKDLPTEYTPQTQAAFFRFFQKYGTHFVSSVRMGGRIYYEFWIDKSYGMQKDDVQASLKLDYTAAFSANGKASWNQTSEVWRTGRRTQVRALGGDDQLLNGLGVLGKGESYAAQYTSWVNSVGKNPAPVGFSLTAVETLFSGAQFDAVKNAAKDFTSQSIALRAMRGNASILLNGQPTVEPSTDEAGVAYAVIDRASAEVLRAAAYTFKHMGDQYDYKRRPYDSVVADLTPYIGNTGLIVALLIWRAVQTQSDQFGYPTPPLYDMLRRLGAGAGLARWINPAGKWSGNYDGGSGDHSKTQVSYALVGVPGNAPDQSFEDFDSIYMMTMQDAARTPEVDLRVFLRPETLPGKIVYTPT